ncbi:hypothetical protein AAVH_04251 [Aphelenchoides avenae]|nr:hypothetical protein AAVH_04251 [Aphelenchus avenae]
MSHYAYSVPPSSSEPVVVDSLSGDEVDFECPNAALLDEQVFLDRNPLISRSAIAITVANLVCICFTIVWLIRNGFSMDLFSLSLIILSVCTLTINCVIGAQIAARVQEASILTGKQEDFRDYVRRVTDPTVVHEKVAPEYRRGISFARLLDWGKRVYV